MKKLMYAALLLTACTTGVKKEETINTDSTAKLMHKGLYWIKTEKLTVTGDFDGDHSMDTLREHVYSKRLRTEIDSFPEYEAFTYDSLINWYARQDAVVFLSMKKGGRKDALRFENAFSLYCLINIGDTNKDGLDELAIATDWCDQSRVNTCRIYSFCRSHWKELKSFGIHEDAFDDDQRMKPGEGIKSFLEKRNGVWYYNNYMQVQSDSLGENMKELKIKKKCS
jgi:hypothetical protein